MKILKIRTISIVLILIAITSSCSKNKGDVSPTSKPIQTSDNGSNSQMEHNNFWFGSVGNNIEISDFSEVELTCYISVKIDSGIEYVEVEYETTGGLVINNEKQKVDFSKEHL